MMRIAERDLDANLSIIEPINVVFWYHPDIIPYIVKDRTSKDNVGEARDAKRM